MPSLRVYSVIVIVTIKPFHLFNFCFVLVFEDRVSLCGLDVLELTL